MGTTLMSWTEGGTLWLAMLGGLVCFASTAGGSLLSLGSWKGFSFLPFRFSIDFALGLMLSAVAFTLVGPVAVESAGQPALLREALAGFMGGAFLIAFLKVAIDRLQTAKGERRSSELLLALALMVHNFPEGLASGASMAGLDLKSSLPILGSISLQNVPEGMLMVVCLRALGWNPRNALLGGLASGLVELAGGIAAGFAMSWTASALPVLLMMAGGAMLTSVLLEMAEKGNFLRQLKRPEFAMGLLAVPLLQIITG